MSNGVPAAGIEYYLPLFFEQRRDALRLPARPRSTLVLHHDVAGAIQEFWRDAHSRYKMLGGDPDRPLLPPAQLFVPAEEFYVRAQAFARIDLLAGDRGGEPDQPVAGAMPLPPLAVDRRAQDPLAALKHFLQTCGLRVLIAAESPGRRETMATLLRRVRPASLLACASFEEFMQQSELLHRRLAARPRLHACPPKAGRSSPRPSSTPAWCAGAARAAEKRSSVEGMLRDLSELKVGDPVVHEQHGIGRYDGLVNLDLGEGKTEFLLLEYDGGDKLYVPVSQLGVIGRYSGAQPEEAPLHKLGSGQWDKAKARAAKQVRDTAAELLALYAKRAAR